MDNTISKKNERIYILIISAVFIMMMLLSARFTSPLYPNNYGGDSAIFMLMGKGMTEGKVLYTDMFDHKGPVLFFIEALGYILGGRTGIFILECAVGIVTVISLYYTCKLIYAKQNKYSLLSISAVLIFGFAILFYTFSGGNLSEEYSLPFITVSLYFMTKYALNAETDSKHPVRYAFFYGIAISAMFLIRLNNAATVCAGILVIFIYLIYKKEFKNLFMNLLFGVLGFAVVAIPIIIYFASKSALYDMIYATFIYNFKYTNGTGHASVIGNIKMFAVLYLPLIISFVLFVTNLIKTKFKFRVIDWILAASLVINAASLWLANQYSHYFTVFVPVYMFTICLYGSFSLKNVKTYLIGICLLVYMYQSAVFAYASVKAQYIDKSVGEKHNTVSSCLSIIPEEEKNSVIGYNLPAAYYLDGDILPCHKYYIQQDWWSKADRSINSDFIAWLEEDTPLWVMVSSDKDNMSENIDAQEKLTDILESNYELKSANEYMCLYRVKVG